MMLVLPCFYEIVLYSLLLCYIACKLCAVGLLCVGMFLRLWSVHEISQLAWITDSTITIVTNMECEAVDDFSIEDVLIFIVMYIPLYSILTHIFWLELTNRSIGLICVTRSITHSFHTEVFMLRGGLAVGRWTCDLQVAGSIPGRSAFT